MDPADKTDLETFSETFGGGSTSDPLEDSSPTGIEDDECEICSKKYTAPRVLSCLHVFCEGCLDGLLSEATGEEAKGDTITCPKCSQDTKVGIKGASCLPLDYVLTNILDMSAIESMTVLCTSCKANEKAVARCSDCANFLCPNCNTAHQFMRCFENHHVVAFEDLKKSHEAVPIHKPIFCEAHPAESMKFYCFSCQVVTCNDCLLGEHKGPEHRYERLAEAEPRQREELHALMSESRSKVTFCEDASELLDNALTELQAQRDAAHDLIGETFHSYRAILEHNRDQLLKQLQESHTRRELHIMDTFHSVEKTMEKIEDACKFTSRLLEHGNTAEVLSLKRVVGAQLLHLINNTPKPDVSTAIHFDTDLDKFEAAVKATFGSLRAELASTPKETSPPPLLNGGGPMVPPAAGSSTVTSSPVSMQSSLEGELGPVAAAFSLPPPPVVATVPPPPPPLRGLTSIQEYNLQQLANLAEKEGVAGGPAPTPPGDSPTPGFTLADLFSGDLSSTSNAINNLQALAKLGSVSLNNQGKLLFGDPALGFFY